MADRTVKVDLTARVDRYAAEVNDAANDTKRLREQAEKFAGKEYAAKLKVDTKQAQANVDRLKKRISQDDAQLGLDIRAAELKAVEIERKLSQLKAMDSSPSVDLKIAQAEAALGKINTQLETLHNKRVTPEVHAELTKAQAELAAFQVQLNQIDGQTVTATANVTVGRSLANVKMLAAGLALLAPAAAGSAVVATGAIGGITTWLGVAGAAAATAGLAFSGMGEVIAAQNAYAIDPSAENLKKLNDSLRGMDGSARAFAKTVSDLRPHLDGLRMTAQRGLLPGAEAGLRSLMGVMPNLNGLIDNTSRAMGDLAREGGAALNSPFWKSYIDFLKAEAGPTITGFGQSLGNLVKGFAGLQMGFAPVARDMIAGLKNMSASFAEWATTLDTNQGFQEFISYVRENGPKLVETLGSIGMAAIKIVGAFAPIAPVVVTAIKGLADAIAAVMGSDFGPWVAGAATALGALVLASKGLSALKNTAGLLTNFGQSSRAAAAAASAAGSGMTVMGGAAGKAAGTTSRFGAAAGAVGRNLPLIGAALIVGALAYDSFNLSASEGAAALTEQGAAAAGTRAELAANSQKHAEYVASMGPMMGSIREWMTSLLGTETTLEQANAALEEQIAVMGPLEASQARAAQGQQALNDAIRQFGPNSQQAIDAQTRLAGANGMVEVQSRLAGLAGREYNAAVIEMAGGAGPAADAAAMLASNLTASQISAAGATVSINDTGQAIATLPNGKQIVINAETMNASTQIAAVGGEVRSLPVNTPVRVEALTVDAQTALRNIGLEVTQLPDGSFEVIAKTEQARQAATDLGLTISGMQPEFGVHANVTPAQGDIHGTQTLAQQRQTFEHNANPQPANDAIAGVFSTAQQPQIFDQNSNVAPAAGAVAGVHADARVPEVFPGDANVSSAQGNVDGVHADARVPESFTTDSDGGPAMGVLQGISGFIDSLSRTVVVTVKKVFGFSEGGISAVGMANGGVIPADVVANATGNKLGTGKRYNGKALRQMPAGGARMVQPNTWRVVGDRMDVAELYAPLDGSGRSLSLIAQGAAAFGKALIDERAMEALTGAQFRMPAMPNIPRRVDVQREMASAGASRGDHNVTINAPIYNPRAERGSDSVQSHLSRLADLGLFGDD